VGPNFNSLEVKCWISLEMAFFIPPNTFVGVAKLHIFLKKILDNIRVAISYFYVCVYVRN